MKKLIDIAEVLRSKNAGPLYITFDIIFSDLKTLNAVINTSILTQKLISQLYDVDEKDVAIIKYEVVNSVKITIPRKIVSGSIYDTDIYGCGQHMPLANIIIPLEEEKS